MQEAKTNGVTCEDLKSGIMRQMAQDAAMLNGCGLDGIVMWTRETEREVLFWFAPPNAGEG